MTHRGPFQPLPFCDSVINIWEQKSLANATNNNKESIHSERVNKKESPRLVTTSSSTRYAYF